ncbi:transporter substrate-binding domain-containing protein [Fundidesulfovibrio terrae]|uniref:transporter substrate-binding domain-containing protein n=1 Tax=Fundidesulfovibrio terrae TaxID=2922866 RepID=UPI001FAEEB5A|nr:transporter substrate-binding domain-containing protein [Fundidesulfovibrio terrae]
MVRLLAGIRAICAAFCVLALSTPALAGTPVKVGVYNFAPLLFYENGQAQGLFVDVLRDVAAKQQWDLEFVFGSWPECLSRLEKNEIDILLCMGWSEEREGKFDFSKEYLFLDWGVIYRRKGAPIHTLFDLADSDYDLKNKYDFRHIGGKRESSPGKGTRFTIELPLHESRP